MESEIKKYNLKVPSSGVVSMSSCWETLKIISKTGKVFLDADLVRNGSSVNEKSLFRVLAYLKYLGFLYEKREKEKSNGDVVNVQRWFESESSEVTDFFFFLRDGRDQEAKDIFIKIIKNHDLYLAVANDLLKSRPSATKIEFKDYLRRKLPNKSVWFYDFGVKVILDLLIFCKLIKVEGNIFTLSEQKQEEEQEPSKDEKDDEPAKEETPKKDLGSNKYIISIYGESTNFQFPINNQEDMIDVEAIIGIIKRKLS